MNEKMLAKSELYNTPKLFVRISCGIILLVILIILCVFISEFLEAYKEYEYEINDHDHDHIDYRYCEHDDFKDSESLENQEYYRSIEHYKTCKEYASRTCRFCDEYESAFDYAMDFGEYSRESKRAIPIIFYIACGLLMILWLYFPVTCAYTLEVTDKRIRGKVVSGKSVDLPVDSVSSVATKGKTSLLVATSSGSIAFRFLKNRDELHKCISDLIIQRQEQQRQNGTVQKSSTADNGSNLHQLKELKELLDAGIITEEEFNQKKKQILDL